MPYHDDDHDYSELFQRPALLRKPRSLMCVIGAIALGAIVGCTAPPAEDAVALVNGKAIEKAQYDAMVTRELNRVQSHSKRDLPPGMAVRVRENVLRRLIDDAIMAQAAQAANIAVGPQEVDAKLKEHRKRFRSADAFDRYLKSTQATVESFRYDLKRKMIRDAVVQAKSGKDGISDAAIEEYYRTHLSTYQEQAQLKLRQMVIRIPQDASKAEAKQIEKQADALRRKAAAPNADFAALAKKHSQAPSAARGGEMGWIRRRRLREPVAAVLFQLDVGAVSEVIVEDVGSFRSFVVYKVDAQRQMRQKTLDEVRKNIENTLTARLHNKARRKILQDLRKAAKVERKIRIDDALTPLNKQAQAAQAQRVQAASAGSGALDAAKAAPTAP